MSLVQGVNGWYTSSAPDDLIGITVVVEDRSGQPPDAETLANMASDYELELEVWGDIDRSWLETWGGYDGTSQHSYTLVDEDGIIVWRRDDGTGGNMSEIIAAVDLLD